MEIKYYINKLYICNFKPFIYGNNPGRPYMTIDFSNGDETIHSMILSGPNGYGKTSIFQAINFALTGIIDTGDYVDGRKKVNEHIIVNDLSKSCFIAVEFKDNVGQYTTLIRYAEKGIPGTVKKTEEEAPDFRAYIIDGKFHFHDFKTENREEKKREDIAERFGEKSILEWSRRNYIQQEHGGDLILKADKERVNFLSQFIDMETGKYFSGIKVLKDKLKLDIESIEIEIRNLIQKVSLEIKDVQGEEPVCEKAYPQIDYMWDKITYEKTEPFQEYEEHARRVLEVISHLPEYKHNRKVDLMEEVKKSESIYKYYILSLYKPNQVSAYKESFYKKEYLQKLLTDGDELWNDELKQEYLTGELINQIQQIRQKRQTYFYHLNDKQLLYKEVEKFRKAVAGQEEVVGDIFNEQCPLCGSSFEGKENSLALAIIQAESIFEGAKNILDMVLEDQNKSWKAEISAVKKQIAQVIKSEIGKASVYKDIQSMDNYLKPINLLEKNLNELNQIQGENQLTIFLNREKFNLHYKEINNYDKAISDLKIEMEDIGKTDESIVIWNSSQKYELDKIAYAENKEYIISLSGGDDQIEQLKTKINYLEWKKNEKLALEYSANKKTYESKLEEIRNLYVKNMKLDKVLDCQEAAKKEYLNDIMKYLEIPLYIYSGKLIQTHQSGLGVFCFTGQKDDALTEFKMSTYKNDINQKLDVSNKFSAGQKNVTNIALTLALKKIAATNLDIFMIDDPCQSLDELNIASFVEIMKNEFTNTQIILSTHEDKIASYIKYKNDKVGKDIIMFNVQEELYSIIE